MKKVLLTILLLSVFGLVACSSGNNPEEPVIPVNNDPPVIAASLKRSEYVVGYSFDPAKEVIASAVDNSGNAIGVTVTVKVNGADAELNKCVLETAGDDYEFTVSAKDAADRTKTEKLSFTVQADTVAPEIAVAGGTVLPAGTVISVNSLAAVTDNSGNITDSSCKITYFDGTEQDIMSGSLTVANGGFYDVSVTATDYSGNTAKDGFRIVVEGTYLNELDDEDINTWVSNSYVNHRPNGTAIRSKVETAEGYAFKFDTVAEEEVSFSIPVSGIELKELEQYDFYMSVYTDADIEIGNIGFTAGVMLSDIKGDLNKDVKKTLVSASFVVDESKRIPGPVIYNAIGTEGSFYIDYIMLIKKTTGINRVVKTVPSVTQSVDESGNVKLKFSNADGSVDFFISNDETLFAGEKVNVTMKYKLAADSWVMGANGAMIVHGLGAERNLENAPQDGEGWLEYTFTAQVVTDERVGYNSSPAGGAISKVYGTNYPHIALAFLLQVNAEITIKEMSIIPVNEITSFTVTDKTGYETDSRSIVDELKEHVIDLDLGGNTLYMLPTVTGMSNLSAIWVNDDGDVFVIDGGFKDDYQTIYHYLTELGKDTIKGWFFTHPHEDHFNVFAKFVSSYADEISIEKVYYAFSLESEWYEARYSVIDKDFHIEYITAFKDALEVVKGKGTIVEEPVTGNIYNFGSLTFDVIYSPKNVTVDNGGDIGDYGLSLDKYGFNPDGTRNSASVRYNVNDLSTVIKITAGDKTFLFFGDCGPEAGKWLKAKHQNDGVLEADFVQMAHHCQAGVDQDVYNLVKPHYAFFNCNYYMWVNLSGRHQTLTVRSWIKALGATAYCGQLGKDGKTGDSIVYIFK